MARAGGAIPFLYAAVESCFSSLSVRNRDLRDALCARYFRRSAGDDMVQNIAQARLSSDISL